MTPGFIRAHQRADGAFLSELLPDSGRSAESNGAVTALCLDAIWPQREDVQLDAGIAAALDYLESCETPDRPGHFCLYPGAARPTWMAEALPPELDATALIAVTLHRYGRRSLGDLQAIYREALVPVRLEQLTAASEPWHDYDVFGTWLVPDMLDNPVDVAANVNALVLLELLGQPMPEIPAIRLMLARALDWAGSSKERMQRLSPWHPEPVELLRALERAERLGVGGLGHMAAGLRQLDWVQADLAAEEPLALRGAGDGRHSWSCELLHELRRSEPGSGTVRRLRRVQ
ncbi:hypothetical protein [Mangrovicoccus sp. HB161399]|uniref:hypothetical protein n=1 Tax=Mangrovicoccus sp. HB161399 TaxID=2720392 RepID=UPI0015552E11|nr:hypothetical protein [Mangrovicoccus sp. HB161399]